MDFKNIVKQALPVLIAIGVFVLLSVIYFSPVLEGKQLAQTDELKAQGMAKELVDYNNATGKDAHWTNSMFGGMPAYQIRGGQNNNIFNFFTTIFRLGLPYTSIAILFVYFLGFYIALLTLKIDKWLSLVGALAFALGSYNIIIIAAGHITKAYAIAFMAPVIAGIMLTFDKKYIAGAIVTMFFLGIEVAYNHLQITYYLALMIGIYFIYQFILTLQQKNFSHFLKASGFLAIAAILAVAPATKTLWTTYEYGQESIRGESELIKENKSTGLDKDYALSWSYGIQETATLLIPNAKGGASGMLGTNAAAMNEVNPQMREMISQSNHYWGNQPFTSGPVYFGIIVFFLFVVGMFIVQNPIKWWVLAVTIFSVFLAWGQNFSAFTDLMFYHFPLYNKFRTVSMALVIAGVTIPLMAVLAVQEILNAQITKELKLSFLIAAASLFLILAVFYVAPKSAFDFISTQESSMFDDEIKKRPEIKHQVDAFFENMEAARVAIFRTDTGRSILFLIVGFALIGAFIYTNKKFKAPYMLALLGFFILADQWTIDRRYLNNDYFQAKREATKSLQASKADQIILKDNDPNFRVLNLRNPFNDGFTPYFHKSIGGYHGAKLRRYQELIENQLSFELQALINSLQQQQTDEVLPKLSALNMLNTKYIIYNPDEFPLINFHSNGNAWFVGKTMVVNNANEELAGLRKIDTKSTALIDQRFSEIIAQLPDTEIFGADTGRIQLVDYKPDHLTYKTQSTKKRFAVFSEIYYNKGWKAYLDGKETPYARANYVLRAMVVPAGKHTIEFKFEPQAVSTGKTVALIASILVVLVLVYGAFWSYKKFAQSPNSQK